MTNIMLSYNHSLLYNGIVDLNSKLACDWGKLMLLILISGILLGLCDILIGWVSKEESLLFTLLLHIINAYIMALLIYLGIKFLEFYDWVFDKLEEYIYNKYKKLCKKLLQIIKKVKDKLKDKKKQQ